MSHNFHVKNNRFNIDGHKTSRLEFVDLCAAFGERLNHWRETAREHGLPEKKIKASLAIDLTPRDEFVHRMDVLAFLSQVPTSSVVEVNGDYLNDHQNQFRTNGDRSVASLATISKEVARILIPTGKFYLTMPLSHDQEVREAVASSGLHLRPIAFGYMGFLGGKNDRFPAEGLPAVEPIGHFTRSDLASVKEGEEHPGINVFFAEQIGKFGYLRQNPVRYLATKYVET